MPYSIHELIYRNQQRRGCDKRKVVADVDYQHILDTVRSEISRHHAEELAQFMGKPDFRERLRTLIMRYVNLMALSTVSDIATLVDNIYNDMAGLGLIDLYLADPEVEEININGWRKGEVWIVTPEGKQQAPDGFVSVDEGINMTIKAARLGDVTYDGVKPYGDSYIANGIRMSGAIPPVADKTIGGIASIRKQKPTHVTRENIVRWGTATDAELDLLITCVMSGISVAIAGATGSGKTADMSLLLENLPDEERIVTIEDTRELNLIRTDDTGRVINDRVHLLTKEAPYPVSMQDLLRLALRLHPQTLVPAEMRGVEAWTVQEAGRTGHTIVSTLHANGAIEAYDRILTMCLLANTGLSEERILKNIIGAFPLVVFKRQLRDGSRKYMEIFEATGVKDGEVIGNTIFKFIVSGKETDARGKITKILGEHVMVGILSERLCQKLFDEGIEQDFIRRYNPEFKPIKG